MGGLCVGKNCIINRIKKNEFDPFPKQTVGVEMDNLILHLKNSVIEIIFEQYGGDEKNIFLIEYACGRGDAIILVYDITDKLSFDICKFYNDRINIHCTKNIKKLLLGNKCDEKEKRDIKKEEGLLFSSENHYKFKEISCLTGENVFEIFEEFIIDIYNDLEQRELDSQTNKTFRIKKSIHINDKKKENCC